MTPEPNLELHGEERAVTIDTDGVSLAGTLALQVRPLGLVLFAHGSGSSRDSPRNRYVAQVLQSQHIGTLLFDLLTSEEERLDRYTGKLRFNVSFLAERLTAATLWVGRAANTNGLKLGYFGASTGAAAALIAAAEFPDAIAAVVSRGGRPDLAGEALGTVQTPTLLIVGGNDEAVLSMNRDTLAQLKCEKKLVVIPGATHLFEEPGALDEVARIAAEWFTFHFAPAQKTQARSA